MKANRLESESGFTLMEILVAMVILVVVAALAVPIYQNYTISAKTVDAISALEALELEVRAPAVPREGLVTCDKLGRRRDTRSLCEALESGRGKYNVRRDGRSVDETQLHDLGRRRIEEPQLVAEKRGIVKLVDRGRSDADELRYVIRADAPESRAEPDPHGLDAVEDASR